MRTLSRAEWDTGVAAVRARVVRRWRLSVGEPLRHDGGYSWVAPVRDGRGTELILKLGWYQYESAHEADGLRVWQGNGAVRVHASAELDGACALLLERCRPGTPLRSVAEPAQDLVVADLLRRLWIAPPAGHRFRTLRQMCERWVARFGRRFARVPDVLDPGLAREGMRLFRTLPRTAGADLLLCTDLHAGNILAATREPWLMIDPKPFTGDPAYDVVQHLLNCSRRLAADPAGLAHRLADLLDLDRDRVRLWLFARCVVESAGWPELRPVAARLAP